MLRNPAKHCLILACAIAALSAGVSHGAQAQTQIYGGGSTLAAKVYDQQFAAYQQVFDPTINYNFVADGSGKGQAGFLNNDPSQHGYPAGTTVAYGASDATLSSDQISGWATSPVGHAAAGGLIQLPSFGTPITFVFKLNGQRADGTIQLTDTQLCGIFSGKITTWNDPALAGIATHGAAPTGTIQVVYRADGSGTTFLTTQHLAAVCTASTSNITFTATTTFASLFGGTPPSNFTGATGSGGVQAAVMSTNNSIAYLSPDYTLVAPINTGAPGFPPVASVKNGNDGKYYLPTSSNSATALANAPAPSDPRNPALYVPAVANPGTGYPVVGFTTWDVAQCYADNNVASGIAGFLFNLYASPALTNLLGQNGFSLVPSNIIQVINDNIFNNNNGLNIDIQEPAVCRAAGASGPGTFAGR